MFGRHIGQIILALLFALGPGETSAAEPLSCDAAVASAAELNGFRLFEGAVACAKAKSDADANYLLIAGQIRSMTDLTLLKPVDTDMERTASLYSQIYYQYGGMGVATFYRSKVDTSALEARLRAFSPAYVEGYDPGWTYLPSSKTDIYAPLLANQRDERVWEMLNYALKLQDGQYFALQQQLDALMRENNNTFIAGTPAANRYNQIYAQQRELAKTIPALPPPAMDASYLARLNEPDAELAAAQVAAGFNGPADSDGVEIWRSADEARASWLSAALGNETLDEVLAKIDFATQSLVGFSIGAFSRASGDISFSELRYDRRRSGYSVSIKLGAVPEECEVASATSYPFIIGLVEAVPGGKVMASGRSNFGSACHAIVSANPTPFP